MVDNPQQVEWAAELFATQSKVSSQKFLRALRCDAVPSEPMRLQGEGGSKSIVLGAFMKIDSGYHRAGVDIFKDRPAAIVCFAPDSRLWILHSSMVVRLVCTLTLSLSLASTLFHTLFDTHTHKHTLTLSLTHSNTHALPRSRTLHARCIRAARSRSSAFTLTPATPTTPALGLTRPELAPRLWRASH
eukprot:3644041-Rhodomonas_salina.2